MIDNKQKLPITLIVFWFLKVIFNTTIGRRSRIAIIKLGLNLKYLCLG